MNASFFIGFLLGAASLYAYSDTVRRNVIITNRELELLIDNKNNLDNFVVQTLSRRGLRLDEYGNVVR